MPIDPNRLDKREALRLYGSLTPTEHTCLHFLHDVDLATIDQVGLVVSGSETPAYRDIVAGRALNSLVKKGLAERYPPAYVKNNKTRRRFFALSVEGMYVAIAETPKTTLRHQQQRKAERLLNSNTFDHHLATVDLYTRLAAKINSDVGELLEWQSDGREVYLFKWLGSRRRLEPDARGVWRWNDGSITSFFVEFEISVGGQERIADKVNRYSYYWESGAFIRRENSKLFPVVIFVTTTTEKANQLIRFIQPQPEFKKAYFRVALTCVEYILEHGIFGEIWWRVGDGLKTFNQLMPTESPPKLDTYVYGT